MTTDITELAQREKFEAWWERTQHNGNPPRFGWECWRDGEGYKVDDDESELDGMWEAWKAAGAELVEALEKAQKSNAFLKGQLSDLANFNPDWDKLEASYDSWREIAAELLVAKERIAELESRTFTTAATDVLAERQRQITAEGWTPEHDDEYQHCEMAVAAACYIMADDDPRADVPELWPWPSEWWKPTDVRRDLVKAGALILAEIERLDRAAGIKWEAE
ncbi:hypothetical protein [Klebsiella michiganensis]|uniref:hypothetical protein n=1 Tax=Klebsiella michiganensis TaxID=1134687 RepID=UPI00300A24BD